MGTLGGGGLSGGGGDINSLGGVSIVAPTNGQFLVYNSVAGLWENSNGGGSSGYTTIQGQGVSAPQQTTLNFANATFTVTNNVGNSSTDIGLGTLPVANGGTNSTSYTQGSVIFAGTGGTSLAQDNTRFFWDDTGYAMKLRAGYTYQFGTLDAFSRSQIWNFETSAVLRLGSLGADGDPTTTSSEGIVVYGPAVNGMMDASNWGIGRVKVDRLGLLSNVPGGLQDYYFRADPNGMFLQSDLSVKTFNVDRNTGTITTSLTAGYVISNGSGVLSIGTSYGTIENAGIALTQRSLLNFSGSGITAVDNAGATRTDVSLAGTLVDVAGLTPSAGNVIVGNGTHFTTGTAYQTVENSTVAVTQRDILNFTGTGITAVDDGGNSSTDVSLASTLQDVAGLTPTAGNVILGNLAGTHFVDGTAANILDNYAPVNYTATSATVDGNFAGIDTKLGTIAGSAITALTGDVVATGPGSVAATIQANVVTNAKLAQAPANTIKGNNTAGLANEADLTATQVTAMLNTFTGDTGAGGLQGLVVAPPAGSKAAGDFLSANGSWAYVDQSKPIYPSFSEVTTASVPYALAKLNNIVTYTGITGKLYAITIGAVAATITIFDVTDEANPVLCSSMATLAGAYNVSVATIAGVVYAFVASSGSHTLYIVNITNPYAPTITTSYVLAGAPGSLYGIVYANGYVYLATQSLGLTVLDVGGGLAGGTLLAPVQSFQEGAGFKSFGVAISGNYLYTTQYVTSVFATRQIKSWALTGLGTLDVPSLIQSFQVTTAGEPLGLTISGNLAFVTVITAGVNAVDIINIATPSAMANVATITPTNTFNSAMVAVASGNYLYIPSGSNAGYGGSIDVYDITTPASPIKITTVTSGVANSVFGGIALSNGYIFVADYGVAPGSTGTLDVFTQILNTPVFGAGLGSTLTLQSLTPNTALISSASDGIISSITTATELSYVHGATSNIQAQINAIMPGAFPFTDITAASQTIAVNNGYTASNAGAVTFALPAVAAYGTTFEISTGSTNGGWIIGQAAGQSIRYGNLVTTVGVGGNLASTNQGDSVRVLCIVANTTFQVLSSQGEINVT